jgi:hypothetical protein
MTNKNQLPTRITRSDPAERLADDIESFGSKREPDSENERLFGTRIEPLGVAEVEEQSHKAVSRQSRKASQLLWKK